MFLSRDILPNNASNLVHHLEAVQRKLNNRTRQLKQANQKLAHQIAERQQVEAALRQAEEKYRSIFENAVEGIFQTTPEGRYLCANPALARIYGYPSAEELIAELQDIKLKLYVHPDRRTEFIRLIQEYGSVSSFESEIYRRDGSRIWISENARAVRDQAGELLYYEGFVTDISARRSAEATLRASEDQSREQADQLELTLQELQQTEAQLIQSEKLSSLGQLVAGVAHEINNPVNFVCGNLVHVNQYAQDIINLLHLYSEYYPQPVPEITAAAEKMDLDFLMEDFPKTLSSMQVGTERIQEIVQSLRNFSRVDEAQMKSVDLHEGIESTLLILHNRIKANGGNAGISILKEYGNLPLVECYSGLLNQVFMNILSNAIDALEEQENKGNFLVQKPQIRIRTEINPQLTSSVLITIADNGPGMPEKVSCKVFEPFFTTKPTGKGTGLGLSISHEIITQKHGGQLRCCSSPEKGTQFMIEIPIRQTL